MAVDAHLLMKFPRELCAKYKVFPLRIENDQLLLAMIDPRDQELLDQLSRTLGMRVRPRVSPELRMLFFLEQTYGIAREKRFLRVLNSGETEDPRRRYLKSTVDVTFSPPGGATPDTSDKQPVKPSPHSRSEVDQMDDDELDLVYLDDVARLPSQPALPVPEPEEEDDFEVTVQEPEYLLEDPAQEEVEEHPTLELLDPQAFNRALDEAVDRDTVTQLAVRFSQAEASLRVLFLVRGDMAVALTANPTALLPQQTGGLVIPLSSPSLLQRAYSTAKLAEGRAEEDPLQRVICGYLQADTPKTACVAPITVGKRVINLICVQYQSESLAEGVQDELQRMAEKISGTYTRLIREKKAS